MNVEQGAIAALVFMVGFCGTLLKILWDRSTACEKRDVEMHLAIEKQSNRIGVLKGILRVMSKCPMVRCPYRDSIAMDDDDEEGAASAR